MEVPVSGIDVTTCTIPTEEPEADGTLEWDRTTIIVVEIHGGGRTGLGYTYGHEAVEDVIRQNLAPTVLGRDAFRVTDTWDAMRAVLRNIGRAGLASMALGAVDTALWDLKARLLGVSLVTLLGPAHDSLPVVGSGGFTSYSVPRLQEQFAAWVSQGISRVKMRVGRSWEHDRGRVESARQAVGPETGLSIDAGGAYSRTLATELAVAFHEESGVSWFEEPIRSDDLEGLRRVREKSPPGVEIVAGQSASDLGGFRSLIASRGVDVLQVDATRSGGVTEFLRIAALSRALGVPVSAHAAPALHLHVALSVSPIRYVEWFHDHVRVERLLFEGVPRPFRGRIYPDLSRPGLGLELKRSVAGKYAA